MCFLKVRFKRKPRAQFSLHRRRPWTVVEAFSSASSFLVVVWAWRNYSVLTKTLTKSFINCKLWNQMKRLTTDTCRRKSHWTFRLKHCVFNGKPHSGVIPLHLFGRLPRSVERCTAEHSDNGCFHPLPASLLTVYVNICFDGPTFPTFHFQVIVFFYEKCIMHKLLPEYYIVALAIWETSSPAALWKSSLQTGMICTTVVTPHQRTRRLNETLDPDPAGLLRSSFAAGGERGAFRGFAKESLHMLGKPRMWEDQCLCM